MRIKSIEYENFRNFKEKGKVECSTDQKVTIIYGRNGDGKTTFHQLFQWVFYGQVHFNKTTTDKLYNLQFEDEQKPGSEFETWGRINFEHASVEYTLRRTAFFEKSLLGVTKFVREELELQRQDSDHNWRHMDKPVDVIEKLLPSGLSEYFFFDGESMIADLSTKSDDSSKKLRAALYSMFDLDILDMAIDHIGSTELKKSVLGKLYLSKGDSASGSEINIVKTNIENAQNLIEKLSQKNENAIREREINRQAVATISEQIGSSKSKAEYEKQRKLLQRNRDEASKELETAQTNFGDIVVGIYPKLLISKAILDASDILKLKINSSKLPVGLGKALIKFLLSEQNEEGVCICGNPLCDAEKKHIEDFLKLLPPKSYTSIYQEFIARANDWGKGYNKDELENLIQRAINKTETIDLNDEAIRLLDSEQKKSADIESLVETRIKAEARIRELDIIIQQSGEELKKAHIYLNKQMKDFDKLSKDDKKSQDAIRRIQIMEAVLANFASRLKYASDTYSKKLQENIQDLLNRMMDNERRVSVSPDFAVKVYDSFGDESKSEGQFAITSFAYIGGIFKMLRSEDSLSEKEYPLVLDGPFSKLDPTKIQNVVDVIPQFAPQVILFSKDSLQDVFSPEQIGRVWTIQSNVEQNVAKIKEGYLWN